MTSTNTGSCCPVIELRQYTLKPGQRDVLIELFEREFIETQETVGMRLIGQFRDRDRPDRFVWMRGFADMPSRAIALAAFYGGPTWMASAPMRWNASDAYAIAIVAARCTSWADSLSAAQSA